MKRLILLVIIMSSTAAYAVEDEISVGIQGGLNLPGFDPSNNTAFTLGTWTVGVFGEYGLIGDLNVTLSFDFATFSGDAKDYTIKFEGLDYKGTLRTSATLWQPQVGVKYCLYGGYNLAPYIEAKVGYAWAVYSDSRLLNEEGAAYPFKVKNFSEGFFNVTGGFSLDYRLAQMFFAGLGVYFNYAINPGLLEYFISVPLRVSYYW